MKIDDLISTFNKKYNVTYTSKNIGRNKGRGLKGELEGNPYSTGKNPQELGIKAQLFYDLLEYNQTQISDKLKKK